MKKLDFILTVATLTISLSANAQSCISGKAGQNMLIDQMKKAATNSASPTYHIFTAYNLGEKSEGKAMSAGFCTSEDCEVKANQLADLKKFADKTEGKVSAPNLVFKPECVIGANKFEAGTDEISCPSGKRTTKTFDFCMNEEILNYQNAIISNFKACADKSKINTLDATHLFKIFARESTFKPHYAYAGGVGFGQLTSTFVNDLHQNHRGLKYLKAVASSDAHECKAAKLIATKDVANRPYHSNTCAFVTIGEGLERNILYSVLGVATAWDKDVGPLLTDYLEKHSSHPLIDEVKNISMLNSYGPGRADAIAAVKRLRHLPPDEFINRMKRPLRTKKGNLTRYVNEIEDRQIQIRTTTLREPLKSQHARDGAKACLSSL